MSTLPSSPVHTAGLLIWAHFDRRGGRKHCQQYDKSFALQSSVDSLKFHMHGAHKQFAVSMRIGLPSFQKTKTSPSQHSLSLSSHDANTSHSGLGGAARQSRSR